MATSAIEKERVACQIRLLPIHASHFNGNGLQEQIQITLSFGPKRDSITMEISTKETAEGKRQGATAIDC